MYGLILLLGTIISCILLAPGLREALTKVSFGVYIGLEVNVLHNGAKTFDLIPYAQQLDDNNPSL